MLADGSLVMIGFTDPFVGSGNGLVANYNADATVLNWSYCDDTGGDESTIFTPAYIASDGGILVYSRIIRDPDPVTGLEVADTLVTKLTTAGAVVFRREFAAVRNDGTGAEQFAGSIVEDSQGLLYLTGWIAGELFPGATIGGEDSFIRRLDADGNAQ